MPLLGLSIGDYVLLIAVMEDNSFHLHHQPWVTVIKDQSPPKVISVMDVGPYQGKEEVSATALNRTNE